MTGYQYNQIKRANIVCVMGPSFIIYFRIYNNGNTAKMERQIQEKHQLSSTQRVFAAATL
uniref:Uncharacterized protein n=1 Tax=viral metagenome TaxID=1070528 RepID=A0A6C0B704_9ZZZZ